MMKKFFTLIELITVIVVLGILAAIVIPNISSFKEEAKEKAILADARNIQTAVDMYGLDFNGATPTKEKATLGNPQIIEIYGMKPDYLRDVPKDNGAKFWLDSDNTVWASMVDSPTNVELIDSDTDKISLSWNTVDGAKLYKIYSTGHSIEGNAAAERLKYKKDVTVQSGIEQQVVLPKLSKGEYLVTALDKFDFESAPTKAYSKYTGYGTGPSRDYVLNVSNKGNNPPVVEEPIIQNPTAVITMTPENNIDTETNITWSFANSSDPEYNEIVEAEWKLNNVITTVMPSKLTEGIHTIELRVKNENGVWSEWVSKNVEIVKPFVPIILTTVGVYQEITIDQEGTYQIEVWGAKGGKGGQHIYGNKAQVGIAGDFVSGKIHLNKGEKLQLFAGTMGKDGLIGNYAAASTGGGGGGGSSKVMIDDQIIISAKGGQGGKGALGLADNFYNGGAGGVGGTSDGQRGGYGINNSGGIGGAGGGTNYTISSMEEVVNKTAQQNSNGTIKIYKVN